MQSKCQWVPIGYVFLHKVSKITSSIISLPYHFALWVKLSEVDILKYLSYFSHNSSFDISYKLETVCMKCQYLCYGKNINLSFAELAQSGKG